ncbi:MAG: CoA transferase [Chloroflexi bacterium]|nr:CoA transferase [Chloroflexota bacterium]
MTGALEGLRVLEVGDSVSAAYCTKLLADLGADVIKVEPPEGDRARRYGPFREDVADTDASGLFVYLNTNKRGIVLDIRDAGDRATLDHLADSVDVLVEGVEPELLASHGLAYADVRSAHPSLIVTSVSAFGRQGPYAHYRGFGLQVSAGSMVAYRTGDPHRSPLAKPLNEPEFLAGVHAAAATMLAVLFRDRTSRSQYVDVAGQDALAATTSGQSLAIAVSGLRAPASRSGHRVTAYYPWTVLPVADGYVEFITMQDRHWRSFLEEIGNPEWGADPRFQDMWERVQYADELDALILRAVGNRTRADLWEAFRKRRISFQPVQRIDDLVESGHLKERGFFVEALDGNSRPMKVPGAPYQLSGTPWELTRKAPRLGEHTREVLDELVSEAPPATGRTLAPMANSDEPPAAPLEGVRVVDLGQVWAGPLLGQYLADYGAQVIRVNSPAREAIQGSARTAEFDPLNPRAYDNLSRNRLQLSLDPSTDAGRAVLDRLVAVSDIVFDNFSPLGRLKVGLDYERLRKANPRIIVAALSAAGQFGPWADLVTYGPSLTALYGIKSLLGYAGESVIQEDVADLDPTAATYAVIAILAALRSRERTGEGQFIDMAQGEAGVAALAEGVLEYTLNGRVLGPQGNHHRTMAPHGIYPTDGQDSWIAIAVDSEPAWQAFCRVLGHPELAPDRRFADMPARLSRREELDALITSITPAFNALALTAELQDAGVASYPVLDTYGALADEQLAFRRSLVRVTAKGIVATDLFTGSPWRLSLTPGTVHTPIRPVGADTDLVLQDVLGMTAEEVEEASISGAFGVPAHAP